MEMFKRLNEYLVKKASKIVERGGLFKPDKIEYCFLIKKDMPTCQSGNLEQMPRLVYQELFSQTLYPFWRDDFDDHLFENDIFRMEKTDENEYLFIHKPSKFIMEFYKYPLRSPGWNYKVTPEQFLAILYDCRNSISNVKTSTADRYRFWELM